MRNPATPSIDQLLVLLTVAEAGSFTAVLSLNTWRISDQAVRHKLLLAGLGWCGMPEATVRVDIETGRLVRLNLPDWRGGEYTVQAIHKTDIPRVQPGAG